MLETPVLFCIFNRPELTRQVFGRIREARPEKLLVVSDAARHDREGESDWVAEARAIVDEVDWDCEVVKNFADQNMGCKQRIASGITWAFEQTDELIILEDDCLPDATFFGYCDELLKCYRDQPEIMMISGNNFQPASCTADSYYFSHWPHIWGWATWKRAWQHFDADVSDWPQRREENFFAPMFPAAADQRHWERVMENQHAGLIDTWDFPWTYTCWKEGGLTILPDQNLVTNIGFGVSATHTTDAESRLACLPTHPMPKLTHPKSIVRNVEADQYTQDHIMCVCSERPAAEKPITETAHRAGERLSLSSRWKRFRQRITAKG